MHKVMLNRANIQLELTPRTAFLIKSGKKAHSLLRPELPNISAMRTRVTIGETTVETVFIPGSSLKGVFRSTSERVLRSLGEHLACDPHDSRGRCQRGPKQKAKNRKDQSTLIHREQCLACRLFGSQQTAGRVSFADILPCIAGDDKRNLHRANQTEMRSGVSIDRKTGGPSRGKLFESEVVTGGRFSATIALHNFQLWQLALLGIVIEEMNEGEVRIGSSRTRGLGSFSVGLSKLTLWQTARCSQPAGVGCLSPKMSESYGWLPDQMITDVGKPAHEGRRLGGHTWSWEGQEALAFLQRCEQSSWPALIARADGVAA